MSRPVVGCLCLLARHAAGMLVHDPTAVPQKPVQKTCEAVPDLSQDDVMAMCQAYHASYHREPQLQLLQMTNMSLGMAKSVYAQMNRVCEEAFPAPETHAPCNINYVAVVLTGPSRPFLHPGIMKHWKRVLDSIRAAGREPVIFTVFDERSEAPAAAQGGDQLRSFQVDDTNNIRAIFGTMARQHQETFLGGETSMEAHAHKVANRRLREMLTSSSETEAQLYNDGVQAQYMKWVVGLDMLLSYEDAHRGACFSHVIHSRPDFVWTALLEPSIVLSAFTNITDAAYIIHNEAAIMPRNAAGAYFTSFSMQRALEKGSAYVARILHDLVHTAGQGSLLLSASSLAYHGVLFAGDGLDFPGGHLAYAGFDPANSAGFSVWGNPSTGLCVHDDAGAKYLNVPHCPR